MMDVFGKSIDLYLIGGFLGAGKTTFIQHLIAQLGDAKLGLLVNEFGSISIDAPLLRDGEIQLVEINNGSVFCACIGHGFTKTLKAFSEQPIDALLIESSGMADPSSMNTILNQMEPYLARPFNYRGLITIVDATSFEDYIDVILPLQNQVAAADLIILNKEDLVDPSILNSIRTTIFEYQSEAPIFVTKYGQIRLSEIDAFLINHGRTSPSYNTPENRPESWTLITQTAQTQDAVEAFARALEKTTWRMKGYLKKDDGGWIHLDATGHHIVLDYLEDSVKPSRDEGHLVIIGEEREEQSLRTMIEEAWRKCAKGSFELRY